MNYTLINAETVKPQAWRNGGGQTRELLVWPPNTEWKVRVSRADIAADGPFSAFPGTDRWFAVLQGAGVVLSFAEAEHKIGLADEALRFDGATAPACRLIDGPTQDLNLMARQGAALMLRVQDTAWDGEFAMRGLYSTVAGRWTCDAKSCALEAHTLLWSQAAGSGAWHFQPDDGEKRDAAWWLGFTPAPAAP